MFAFIFNKLHKRWRKGKAPLKLHFHMYSKDRDVVSALNEYLKRTKKWRRIGHKFQLPLSYIKPHVEVYSLTVSIWIKDILKETRSDCGVFKNTFQLLPKKNVYRVFL